MKLKWFIIVFVGLLVLNILLRTCRKNGRSVNDKPWKVFGSMDCGWTRKQVNELKNKGITYEFLDCSGDECREGMPTNILPDGSRKVGFTSVD